MGTGTYIIVAVNSTTAGTATAVAVGETSINVSMGYIDDEDADNSYMVKYKLASSGIYIDWGSNPKANSPSPYLDTITGLTPGETYDVQVTYIDGDGVTGTATQTISGVTLPNYATTAGMVIAEVSSATSIDISMPYTVDDDGDNTYTVKYKLSSSDTWLDWGTNPQANAASPYTDSITGLTSGESYDVQLTYNDEDGVSGDATQTVIGLTPQGTNFYVCVVGKGVEKYLAELIFQPPKMLI